jgi:outer membrane protein with beta-barrel domain
MRKRLLITVMMVIVYMVVSAQHKPFQFGFKAGVNMGWFNSINDDYHNEGTDFGASWGFAADFFLMDNYSLTTGFDVLYLNGQMSYPDAYSFTSSSYLRDGTMYRSYRTKYLRLPVIFTMKTNQIKKFRYYGQIGFGIGFLLTAKAKDKFEPSNGSENEEDTHNIYDDMRFTRESLILGAGVEMPIHKSTFARIGILYDNAFINILKGKNTIDPSLDNNGRSSFIELNASLFF